MTKNTMDNLREMASKKLLNSEQKIEKIIADFSRKSPARWSQEIAQIFHENRPISLFDHSGKETPVNKRPIAISHVSMSFLDTP
jgi:plasmid stabilization system protein ParE